MILENNIILWSLYHIVVYLNNIILRYDIGMEYHIDIEYYIGIEYDIGMEWYWNGI